MTSTISTDTIRDLILDCYSITISCKAYPCMNRAKANLVALARRYGLRWNWFEQRWPYRCSRCGSRDIGFTLLPDIRPNSAPDRQADLAAAKALVEQIEAEEQEECRRKEERHDG
jgi:hypothetical protein